MRRRIHQFWLEEDGQDLIEYSLLITFIALATMWVVGSGRPIVNQIWTAANSKVVVANSFANGN